MEDNVSDVNLNPTVYGRQNDKLSHNEDKKYPPEGEQSDNDAEENETVANVNRQFHKQQNKYAVSSIATSLDEANYHMINTNIVKKEENMTDTNIVKKEEIDVPLQKKGNKVTKKITCTTAKPNQNIRNPK